MARKKPKLGEREDDAKDMRPLEYYFGKTEATRTEVAGQRTEVAQETREGLVPPGDVTAGKSSDDVEREGAVAGARGGAGETSARMLARRSRVDEHLFDAFPNRHICDVFDDDDDENEGENGDEDEDEEGKGEEGDDDDDDENDDEDGGESEEEEEEEEGEEDGRSNRKSSNRKESSVASFVVESLVDIGGDKACVKSAESLARAFADGSGVDKDVIIDELAKLWLAGESDVDDKVKGQATAAAKQIVNKMATLPIWREEMNLETEFKEELVRGRWTTAQSDDGDVVLCAPAAATLARMPDIPILAALALYGGDESKAAAAVGEFRSTQETPSRRQLPKINYLWTLTLGGKTMKYVGETTAMVERVRRHLYGLTSLKEEDVKQEAHRRIVDHLRNHGGCEELGISAQAAPRDVANALIRTGALKVYTSAVLTAGDLSDCAKLFRSVTQFVFRREPSLVQLIRFLASVPMVREAVETAWARSRIGFDGAERTGLNRSHPGLYWSNFAERHYAQQIKVVISFGGAKYPLGVRTRRRTRDNEGGNEGMTRIVMAGLVTRHVLANLVRAASAALEEAGELTKEVKHVFDASSAWDSFSIYMRNDNLVIKSTGCSKMSALIAALPKPWTVEFGGMSWTKFETLTKETKTFAENEGRRVTLAIELSNGITHRFDGLNASTRAGDPNSISFQTTGGDGAVAAALESFWKDNDVQAWWEATRRVAAKIKATGSTKPTHSTFEIAPEKRSFTMHVDSNRRVRFGSFMWCVFAMRVDEFAVGITLQQVEGGDIINVEVPPEFRETYEGALKKLEEQTCERTEEKLIRFTLANHVEVNIATLSAPFPQLKVSRKALNALVNHECVSETFKSYLPNAAEAWRGGASLTLTERQSASGLDLELARPKRTPSQKYFREFVFLIFDRGILASLSITNGNEVTPIKLSKPTATLAAFFPRVAQA